MSSTVLADNSRAASAAGPQDMARNFSECTFLTTDIVGSAELHRRHPQAMAAAMDRHDDILHGAIRRAGGDPFKHTGDGVLAIFDDPASAVSAVIEVHRALRALDWSETGRLQLRSSVHTGSARPRGGDYFGPALSTVHRLEGAAHGDQILVSDASVALIRQAKGACEFSLLDLGEHHFKGVEPMHVFQVQADGLPSEFAPLGGKRAAVNGNLPARLSSFLGRDHEVALLREMMTKTRILSLVGPGGIGKTCIAVELARSLQPTFPGGAWMLNLASLERETALWPAAASMLEIDAIPGADRRQQVLDRLRDDRAIVVIDNCEHLLDQVADIVSTLAAACPELSILTTSRQNLGVPGEVQFNLPTLEPAPDADPDRSVAAQLFIERARAARHDFDPGPDDMAMVHEICRSLDYIPLAIEIAAGQVRRYALDRIAKGAKNPLDLSPGRTRSRSDRQQTLRRTLDWSYDLIEPTSQQVLQTLSVFASPFHEEQALAACAEDIDDEIEVLDAMDELIDASLMTARIEGERRMMMLRTVQAFGREKLDQDGRLRKAEQTHGKVMVARARALGQQFVSEEERDAAGAIHDDMPNLRAAFDRAVERDLELAAKLTWPLLLYTYFHRESETAAWATRIMSQPGALDLPDAPILLAGCGAYAFHELGDAEKAHAFLQQGLEMEQGGRNNSQGWLNHVAGQVAFWQRDTDLFKHHHVRAVEQARAFDDVACQVVDLSMAAFVEARTGNPEGARVLLDDLDALLPTLRQPSMIGYVHFARGGVASVSDLPLALSELERAIEWAHIGGNQLGVQRTNRIMSDIKAVMVEPKAALTIQIEALRALPEHGATIYNWTAISRLLGPLAKLKANENLAVLSGALETAPIRLGASANRHIDLARTHLGEEAFEKSAQVGREFDQEATRAYAIDVIGKHI